MSSVESRAFQQHARDLAALSRDHHLFLGGAGAAQANLDADVVALTGGPVEEAERLTQLALLQPPDEF